MVSVGSLVLVCYFTNWAQYRSGGTGQGKFTTDNIDPNLCTHINYAFAQLSNGILAPYEWNDDVNYAKVMSLKTKNPNLKILISVGGWNMGSAVFSNMVTSSRANFITTTVAFLQKWKFDGLDIDWEYPGSRDGSRTTDKALFTTLIKELKAAFKPYGYLLTAAVGSGISTINSGYEVSSIVNELDLVNLMTYDLHGSWESFTGHNAPLYPRANENSDQRSLNIDSVVKYWISNGARANKLVLGLASYGRSFRLSNTNQYGLGAPASGSGSSQPYTNEAGMVSYYELCDCLKNGWTKVYDNEQKVPYIYKGDQWIGYDDTQSLTEKANYIKNNGLGGGMFWALDLDDFSGSFCGNGKYPLINKVKSILQTSSPTQVPTTTKSGVIKNTTKSAIVTTTTTKLAIVTTKTTKSGVTKASQCYKGDGFYPLSGCTGYYRCVYSGTSYERADISMCPSGTLFDVNLSICNWSSSVTCTV